MSGPAVDEGLVLVGISGTNKDRAATPHGMWNKMPKCHQGHGQGHCLCGRIGASGIHVAMLLAPRDVVLQGSLV